MFSRWHSSLDGGALLDFRTVRVDIGRVVVLMTLLRGAVRGTVRGIDILAVGRFVLTVGICTNVLHQHLLLLHSVGENMI